MTEHVKIGTGIFFICIVVIGILFTNKLDFKATSDLIWFVLFGGIFSYVGLFLTYVVLRRSFDQLKLLFYDQPLYAIRYVIDGKGSIVKDILSLYFVSATTNFFALYFLAYTPAFDLLKKLPIFDSIQSTENIDKTFLIFDPLTFAQYGKIEYLLPFMVVGLIIIFVLRYLRRRPDNQKDKNYPGSRPLLVFLYGMFFAVYFYSSQMSEIQGASIIKGHFEFIMAISFMLSLLSVFAVIVAVIFDKWVFKMT